MLTLKEPLQLNTVKPISVHSDILGEKIAANYQLMTVSVSAQDLLHMTTLQPEVFVGLQNENQFITQNQSTQKNEIKIEVINQLLNRLMLYQTPMFTYQDEVYVSAVLQKMGIVNVKEFMQQVSRNNYESNEAIRLLKKYSELDISVRNSMSQFYQKEMKQYLPEEEQQPQEKRAQELWLTVFQRLHTSELNEQIYQYNISQTAIHYKKAMELKLAEDLRQSHKLQLSEIKQEIFPGTQLAAQIEINTFERESIPVKKVKKEFVLQQLAAAMLLQIVQNAGYQKKIFYTDKNPVWQNFTRALYESTEDVIDRFQCFQLAEEVRSRDITQCAVEFMGLEKEENVLLELLESTEEPDVQDESETGSIRDAVLYALLLNNNYQQQIYEMTRLLDHHSKKEFVFNRDQIDTSVLKFLTTENTQININNQKNLNYLELHPRKERENHIQNLNLQTQTDQYELYMDQTDEQINYHILKAADISKLPETKIVSQLKNNVRINYPEDAEYPEQETENLIVNPLTQENSVFENIEDYAAYLNQINEQNVKMHKQYLAQNADSKPQQPIRLDKKTARKNALRALESPEEVLAEIYSKGTVIKEPAGSETESYLKLLDEKTRNFYERLMNGETNFDVKQEAKEPGISFALEEILINQWNQHYLVKEILNHNLEGQNLYLNKIEEDHSQEIHSENTRLSPNHIKLKTEIIFNRFHTLEKKEQRLFDKIIREELEHYHAAEIQDIEHYYSEHDKIEKSDIQHNIKNIVSDNIDVQIKNATDSYQQIFLEQRKELEQIFGSIRQNEKVFYQQTRASEFLMKQMENIWNVKNNYYRQMEHIYQNIVKGEPEPDVNGTKTVKEREMIRDRSNIYALREFERVQNRYTSELFKMIRTDVVSDIRQYILLENKFLDHTKQITEKNSARNVLEQLEMIHKTSDITEVFEQEDFNIPEPEQEELRGEKQKRIHYMRTQIAEEKENINIGSRTRNFTGVRYDERVQMIYDRSKIFDEENFEDIKNTIIMSSMHSVNSTNASSVTRNTEKEEMIEKRVIETTRETAQKSGPDIAQIIQQNLVTQMNEISSQVYEKIERKLESERRRRGY